MAAAFAALSLFFRWLFVVAALFLFFGVAAPRLLAPVFRAWMKLAAVLGWINTRILLILVYYLVVTPIGLLMRLFRRSPLPGGYWEKPKPHSYGDRHFEKQF